MASSLMILSLLTLFVVALSTQHFPKPRLQPVTTRPTMRDPVRARRVDHYIMTLTSPPGKTENDSIVMDTLRALGLARRTIEQPVHGPKAYTRWWERLRAIIGLAMLIVAVGVALAVIVGIAVLGFGFFLEQTTN